MIQRLMVVLLSVTSVALGALLGGVINAVVARYTTFKESQALAGALRAEMSALLDLVERRAYLTEFREVIQRLQRPEHEPDHRDVPGVPVSQEYFAVFDANTAKLGCLGALAARIVRLSVLAKALAEDFRALNNLQDLVLEGRRRVDREVMLKTVRNMCELIETLQEESKETIAGLAEYEQRRWLSRKRKRRPRT